MLLAASRHPLAEACARGLAAASLLDEAARGRLALLVSGGGDSIALLVLMAAIRERWDSELDSLAVLSVDHGLRPEAVLECECALELAATLGIRRREIARVEVDPCGNLLDRARAARYSAALRFVREHGCVAAVTAHTADDRAESLLLGLRRGLGLAALARLAPSAAQPEGELPTLIRPLLSIRRAELRAFLSDLGVGWHEDPSNAHHDRGALRSDPTLAALVDEIARGADRAMDEACELIAFRDAAVRERLERGPSSIGRAEFDAMPQALRGALLRAMVHAAGGDMSQAVLDRVRAAVDDGDRSPLAFRCASGVELAVDARAIRVRRCD